jgi:hypothetical protein
MSDVENDGKLRRAEAAAEKARKKSLRPWYQKKRFAIPIILVVLSGISALNNEGGSDSPSSNLTQSSAAASPSATASEPAADADVSAVSPSATASEPAADADVSTSETTNANETAGQRNARGSAESYIRNMAFSREGLIDQLLYEGYSQADAEYGVDAIDVDWTDQAALSAKSYLRSMAFSKEGLIDQLIYEGFSDADAAYGAEASGADWNEQAALSAASYLRSMTFSRQGLIDQLLYEGFSLSQAEYGVGQNGY